MKLITALLLFGSMYASAQSIQHVDYKINNDQVVVDYDLVWWGTKYISSASITPRATMYACNGDPGVVEM